MSLRLRLSNLVSGDRKSTNAQVVSDPVDHQVGKAEEIGTRGKEVEPQVLDLALLEEGKAKTGQNSVYYGTDGKKQHGEAQFRELRVAQMAQNNGGRYAAKCESQSPAEKENVTFRYIRAANYGAVGPAHPQNNAGRDEDDWPKCGQSLRIEGLGVRLVHIANARRCVHQCYGDCQRDGPQHTQRQFSAPDILLRPYLGTKQTSENVE